LTENLLVSQEGLCSMELSSWLCLVGYVVTNLRPQSVYTLSLRLILNST